MSNRTLKDIPVKVVWAPIANSSQEIALDSRCDETLYFGSRGPGKTDTQLMRFRRRVGLGYGRFWRGVIFDREYKSLDDVVSKSKRWFSDFGDGAEFKLSTSDYKWVWPTGEELLFRSAKDEKDYANFHGQEFPFIGWNELTKYPNSKLYDMMLSCNRSSWTQEKDSPVDANGKPLLPPIPLEIFSTTNPLGAGHSWVKRRFIDPAPVGTVIRRTTEIEHPVTRETLKMERKTIAIKGMWFENPYLPKNYPATLTAAAGGQEHVVKAWLNCDWNIVAGGAFDDKWRSSVHVVPRFVIPHNWYTDRAFDWGSSTPFHVGWWAEANGEEVQLHSGKRFAPKPGSVILFHEWYGTREIGTNIGLKLSAKVIARGIRNREIDLLEAGWISKQPYPGPADNQIRNVNEAETETIEKKMLDEGIAWELSDKSKGTNSIGLQLARDRLEAALTGEGPAIYFMEHCRPTISILPSLPRDEKNIDEVSHDAEDHAWDTLKYRVLKGSNRAARAIKVNWFGS